MNTASNDCPPVTFIVAAKNGGATVAAAIRSALAQDYPGAINIVAVDDGSSDDTLAILRSFEDLRVITHRISRGRAAARNAGLELVDTEFIAIQDADDISLPGRLRTSMQLIQHSQAIAVGTQLRWTDERTGPYVGARWPTDCKAASELLAEGRMPIAHASMLIRTDALLRVGGYSSKYPVAEDLDLLLRISMNEPSARFVSSSEAGVVYQRNRVPTFHYALEAAYWRNVVLADNGRQENVTLHGGLYRLAMRQVLRARLKRILRKD